MYQQELWVYDRETEKIVFKRVSYVPGLYKIFGKYYNNESAVFKECKQSQ